MRRVAVAVVLLAGLVACGGGEDGGGTPSRAGRTSAQWADAWGDHADEACTNSDPMERRCGVVVSARDDDQPASKAPGWNFIVRYDPAQDDAAGNGWKVVQAIAKETKCDLPVKPTKEKAVCDSFA